MPTPIKGPSHQFCQHVLDHRHPYWLWSCRGMVNNPTDWAWRIPYAIQWVWPLPIAIGTYLAPESPYWLVRKGRIEEARISLTRLTTKNNTKFNADNTIALIVQTNEREKRMNEGSSYRDIFRGVDLRRTEITVMAWISQVGCGQWFGGNVTYFLEQYGFPPEKAFDWGLGTLSLGWVATMFAWWVMAKLSRRTIFVGGLSIMFVLLLIVGFMGIPEPSLQTGLASAAMQMLFLVTCFITVGPVVYPIVAEIPSTRLKIKTVVFGRNFYNIASICANFLTAPILNPLGWNLRGKGGFIWAGPCFLCLFWGFFRLPETKGVSQRFGFFQMCPCKKNGQLIKQLTFEEIDVLFENKVNARKFTRELAQEYLANDAHHTPAL